MVVAAAAAAVEAAAVKAAVEAAVDTAVAIVAMDDGGEGGDCKRSGGDYERSDGDAQQRERSEAGAINSQGGQQRKWSPAGTAIG